MQYRITGFHTASGKRRTAKVEASNEAEALTIAAKHGFSDAEVLPDEAGDIALLAEAEPPPTRHPLPGPTVVHRHVQTIEATGKVWKLLTLLSMVTMIIGIVYLIQNGAEGVKAGLAMIVIMAGLFMAIFARIGGWWCHG